LPWLNRITDVNSISLFARLLAIGAVLIGLASCTRYEPPLRIALIRWPPFEFMHLAQEKGFFTDEGIEVRLIEFVAVNDTQRAFEHDKIDGGTFSLLQVLQNRDLLTRRLQIPFVIDYSNGADVVLARPDIEGVAGLRGKRVGVTISPLDIYILTRALELHGMTLPDVSLVYLRTIDMPDALRSGKVDAVFSFPPDSKAIEDAGLARPIFDTRRIPGEILDVLALDRNVIRDRPDDVAGLIRAFYRAVRYAQEHPDEAYRIMAARERVTPESFRQALQSGISMVPLADQQHFLGKDTPLSAVAQRISRVLHERGQLSKVGYEGDLLNGQPAARAAAR
jgi:NitT/TauT family transport system substrate-binding protein